MAENRVAIKRTVWNREQLNRTVDREFKTFTQPAPIEAPFTVEDFFAKYEELFYEIPINGVEGTHEYLVKRSTELYKLSDNTDAILPLLEEITNLRAQILNNEIEITALQEQVAKKNVNN